MFALSYNLSIFYAIRVTQGTRTKENLVPFLALRSNFEKSYLNFLCFGLQMYKRKLIIRMFLYEVFRDLQIKGTI